MTKPICKTCREPISVKDDKWWPPSTPQIQVMLRQRIVPQYGISNSNELIKSLSYNLQYIHFLEVTREQVYLTSVIATMLFKNYIITAVSIIEVLLFCYLKETHEYRASMKKKMEKMLSTAKKKNLWNKDDAWYDELDRLRRLRNSVHINLTDLSNGNSEYWKFDFHDYISAKKMLGDTLHELFANKPYNKYVNDHW